MAEPRFQAQESAMTLQFSLTQDQAETSAAPCVVVGLFEDGTPSPAAARIDEKSGGAIRRLFESGDVTGKLGSTHALFALAGIADRKSTRLNSSHHSISYAVFCLN